MTKPWKASITSYRDDQTRRWNWVLVPWGRAYDGWIDSTGSYTRRATALRGLRRALKRLGIDPAKVEIEE